jgi:hypothetical protein
LNGWVRHEPFSKFDKIASTASLHILNDRSLICKNMEGVKRT